MGGPGHGDSGARPAGQDAAQRRADGVQRRNGGTADDLSLDVEGFGRVKFPVTPAKARKLIDLGQPARFGRGEET